MNKTNKQRPLEICQISQIVCVEDTRTNSEPDSPVNNPEINVVAAVIFIFVAGVEFIACFSDVCT